MNPLHLRRYGSGQLFSETSQQLCRGAGSLKGDSTAHLTVTLPSPKELGAQEDGRAKRKAFRLNRDHQHLSTTKGHLCWSTSQHFLSTVSGQQSAAPHPPPRGITATQPPPPPPPQPCAEASAGHAGDNLFFLGTGRS